MLEASLLHPPIGVNFCVQSGQFVNYSQSLHLAIFLHKHTIFAMSPHLLKQK